MSVLVVQGGYSPALIQQVHDLPTINYVLHGIKLLAQCKRYYSSKFRTLDSRRATEISH